MTERGMSIEKAKAELQSAMTGSTGRYWNYTPAVTAVLAALEQAKKRIAELESQVKAQYPVLPEIVPDDLRDEIINLCDGYEIGDVGAQEIWEACRAAMLGATISNSSDFAIDDGSQAFGNSKQLNYPVWVGVDWAEGCKPSNSPVAPDGWISVCDQMPDPKSERRVCVFTPTPHEDMRYRFVPASLFKAVCSSATHWYYIEPPSASKQEPNQ